jgi:hypothetical protein
MYTQLKNSKWFVTIAAIAGLTLSAANTAMAHGGGGGSGGGNGGGMGRAGSSGMSARSFKSGNSLSSKNYNSAQLRTTKLNTNSLSNSKLNTLKVNTPTSSGTSSQPAKILSNLNGQNSIAKVSATTKIGSPASGAIIDKAGANKVGQLPKSPVQISSGGNSGHGPVINNPKGGCSPYPGHCWSPFGYFGLFPYLYGFGGYGGFGGNGGYAGCYNGSNYPAAGTTSVVDSSPAATVAAPPAIATNSATPAVIVPGVDLQLVDVRMLDNGDASQLIGPRYRVAFRNAGSVAVDHEFNVAVIAADDSNLTANLPMTESRITTIGTGDVTYVDLRLPAKAFEMGTDSHSEFSKLFVFVDSRGEVNETNRDNNATSLDRVAVQPAT